MDFITIDFETANSDRNSPCEIGLTFVRDNKIVETKSWLIKPINNSFNSFNIYIHGIRPEDVSDKPEFNELWKEIKPLIDNQFLIAHNAAFDISVLRTTLQAYQLPFPNISYSCSYIFSKKVWPSLPGYDLKTLCKINNIDFVHHRAGADSKATAELTLKAFSFAGVSSPTDFPVKLNTTIGRLYEGGYKPSETKRIYKPRDLSTLLGDSTKYNTESIFYGRTVVFTGTLSSMVRAEGQQIIADIGGNVGNTVTKDTDFLIVGQQDYRIVGDDGMSNKQEKAIELIKKGSSLEILSEEDFLKNIEFNRDLPKVEIKKDLSNFATLLAVKFSDEADIPSRFKNKEKSKSNLNSYTEIKFQKRVQAWGQVIETIISKVEYQKAWRFITIKPNTESGINSAVYCQDFIDFTDYFVLRRDKEKCSDLECGLLAALHTEFQREIERKIK